MDANAPQRLEAGSRAPLCVLRHGLARLGRVVSFHSGRVYPGDGWPDLNSYVTDTPHFIGQFPALFFALANHHIQEAPIAFGRHLTVDSLFTGVDPLKQDFTGGGHDVKTVQGVPVTPVEALAVGRVTVSFDDKKSTAIDIGKYWDKSGKVVRSMTGELAWDYGRQLVTLSAPKTQAIIGRAAGKAVELPGVTAEIKTPFVSLIFTPLDDVPLAESHHVLITAMARDKQTNTHYSDDGKQLLSIGGPPLLMEPVEAKMRLAGERPTSVRVVDVYGVPTTTAVPVEKDGSFVLGGQYQDVLLRSETLVNFGKAVPRFISTRLLALAATARDGHNQTNDSYSGQRDGRRLGHADDRQLGVADVLVLLQGKLKFNCLDQERQRLAAGAVKLYFGIHRIHTHLGRDVFISNRVQRGKVHAVGRRQHRVVLVHPPRVTPLGVGVDRKNVDRARKGVNDGRVGPVAVRVADRNDLSGVIVVEVAPAGRPVG